jgi:hypothetical protein
MDQQISSISCPNCGQEIDVNELLYSQLNDRLKREYGERLRTEKEKLTRKLREDAREEQSERIRSLREELEEKSSKLKDFNRAQSEIERLKREKDGMKEALEAENERKLSEALAREKETIRKTLEANVELKTREKDHVIEQLRVQLQEAQRKAEQGSMQVQGEVQEVAIQEWLESAFPLDTIEEIKKGQRGADCLQVVNTKTRQSCGTIYYESKRTKAFQPAWIEKFKADIRDRGADIGVLVTEAMPTDMDRMEMRDGVWICSYDEFKGLSAVLRDSIVRLSSAIVAQENKGDKMGMLYDYLTSNEFRLQIEAIVEGFTQMQQDLEAEKRSMHSIWKKREKQIQKVLLNTNHMYSTVKGIAGSAVQSVPLLELPEGEPDDS